MTTLTGATQTSGQALDSALVAFDFETTGPDPDTARIVTAAVVDLTRDSEGTWSLYEQGWLLDPGVPIPDGATAVHGITTARAREDGTPAREGVSAVLALLDAYLTTGLPVVGHNISYDLTVLDREARRHGLTPLVNPAPVLDTMVLDKAVDTYRRGKRTLTATAAHYGITLGDAHDATADALAAARIVWLITRRHPHLAAMPLAELHDAQTGWRAEQCASLQDYFRRTDPAAVVDGTWPVHSLPHGWDPTTTEERPA